MPAGLLAQTAGHADPEETYSQESFEDASPLNKKENANFIVSLKDENDLDEETDRAIKSLLTSRPKPSDSQDILQDTSKFGGEDTQPSYPLVKNRADSFD
jgi:hypothetical protein